MEFRWVVVWIYLVFAITFTLLYNLFTETLFGFISYIPYIIAISYACGVENGLNKNPSKR